MKQNARSSGEILARLDRIPTWPYPKRVLAIVGAGVFFAFFDIVTIAATIPVLVTQFGVSADEASATITSGLAGYIVGALVVARITDRVGRKVGLLISVALFSGGSLMTATSTELWHVIAWRFVSGMGIGADIAGITTYLAEISPKRIRGRYTAISVGIGFLGIASVPFIAELLVPNYWWGWRALFVIGAIGGLVIAVGRGSLIPSPRWLVSVGRVDEARRVIEQAERHATRHGEVLPDPDPPGPDQSPLPLRRLFQPPLIGRLALFTAIWFSYYVGNYAWISLMPELYVKHGLKLSSSLWVTAISSLGFVVGSIAAVWLVDRTQRKWACAGVAAVWSVMLLVVGWYPSVAVATLAGFFASATIAVFIPITYTLTGESFPTALRATSIACTDGIGHLGGVFCAYVVLGAYDLFEPHALGYQAALTTMSLTGIVAAILLTFGGRTTATAI